MAKTRHSLGPIEAGHPCIAVEAAGARFALHPPTPFTLDLEDRDYKLLLPFGSAAIDVAIGSATLRRIRARSGDLVLAEPGTAFAARHVEPLEFMVVTLAPERVRRVAGAASGPAWLTRDLLPWHDPAVAVLGAEMRRVLLGEALPSSTYLGALADALVTRIVVDLAGESAKVPRRSLAPATLAKVLRHIDSRLAEPIAMRELATIAGLSPAHFARAFTRETGDPPHRFLMKRRVCRARDMLSKGDESIADIAARAGFSSQAHLSTAFLKAVGTSPAKYRSAFSSDMDLQLAADNLVSRRPEEQRRSAS